MCNYPAAQISIDVTTLNRRLACTWVAFIGTLITGLTIFVSQATTCAGNFLVQIKMLLLVLAGINVAVFHGMTVRAVAQWDIVARVPTAVRLAGATSLAL